MTMRLFVLGATGNTGTQIVDLALARGHQVTAFVRSPQKITRRESALTVIKGDPLRVSELAHALPGHDAVLSALGPSGLDAFRQSTLLTECAASTVAAMKTAGVGRLGIVSAALLFPEKGLRFVLFRWLLQRHIRDLVSMEAVVRATDFDWTIARPPRLICSPEATYRRSRDALPLGAWEMSFRSVAAFLLDCVEQGTHQREVVGLARAGGDT
jgi:putative NADH-flavin reductase